MEDGGWWTCECGGIAKKNPERLFGKTEKTARFLGTLTPKPAALLHHT